MSQYSRGVHLADRSVGPETLSELDQALGDPLTEAKFNGLKRLNAKKVAKLMAQIDLNQNELMDMKVEGKDNVRTRIIQGLKKKIGYQETVLDYLKGQLIHASAEAEEPLNAGDIDDIVMRKTIGGPKRFRPVGRVEIEKKISDLEKKIKGVKTAKANKDKAAARPTAAYNDGPDAEEKAAKIMRIKVSEQQAEYLQRYEANEKKILYLTDILQDMRNRSSQQVHARKSTAHAVTEDEFNKLKGHNEDVSAQLDRSFADLAVTEEELIQCKADVMMANEHLQLEYDRILSLHQKSIRQNESILTRMADLEGDLDKIISGTDGSNLTTKAFNTKPGNSSNAAIRCRKLKEDIKKCQDECKELEQGVKVTNNLKDSIRLKNEEIRELKRSMQELARLENTADSPSEEKE